MPFRRRGSRETSLKVRGSEKDSRRIRGKLTFASTVTRKLVEEVVRLPLP